jgi:uncharacterized repeat protein (TIGR02543 family)
MIRISKKILSVFLAITMLCSLIPAAVATSTITIKVRVYDQSTGLAYTVGTAYCEKETSGVQSKAYKIPALTDFVTDHNYGTVSKVVGNWYYPSGDRNVGSTVYWSNNSSTATMTYWVSKWEEIVGTTTAPGTNTGTLDSKGNITVPVQVVYTKDQKTMTYGERITVNATCTSTTYHTHGSNCFIAAKSLMPANIGLTIPSGYTFLGINKTSSLTSFNSKTLTASTSDFLYNAGDVFYLVYKVPAETGGTTVSSHTVKFMNGSTELFTKTVMSDESICIPNLNDATANISILGWSSTANGDVKYKVDDYITNITSDMTLYAVWPAVASEYTVTFVDGDANYDEVTVASGECVAEPTAPTKEDYTFAGWFVDAEKKYDFSTPVTSDLTLVALWAKPTTVSLNYLNKVTNLAVSSAAVTSLEVDDNNSVTMPDAPAYEGEWEYTFLYWVDEAGNKYYPGKTYNISDDLTLYPVWKLYSVNGDSVWNIDDALTVMQYVQDNTNNALTDEQTALIDDVTGSSDSSSYNIDTALAIMQGIQNKTLVSKTTES